MWNVEIYRLYMVITCFGTLCGPNMDALPSILEFVYMCLLTGCFDTK